jgi:LysW-gamma-L-lysine carboxypeptidase
MAHMTPEHAEALLENLVSIASPSYEEAGAVAHLVAWMNTHGYQAYTDDAGNAVGVRAGAHPTRDVVLLGHIDTFGGFPPVYRDGRLLYGRGSVDAKGSLCAFAVAGAQAQLPDDVRLIVVGAVEEECPTSKGARAVAERYRPSACIIGEPSQWDRMTLGYKGRLLFEWTWRGDLAHSAAQVPTGAERAVAFWGRVRAYADAYNADKTRLFERLDATLQELNTAQDGAYGTARMVVGFRLPPALTPQTVIDALAHDDGASVRPFGCEHAVLAPKDNALTRAFRGAIRAEGGTPAFVHKTGTSDMNIVAQVWDCPILAYGAGDSALDHTPHEHIDLDDYLRAVRVLTHVLEAL